VGLAVMVTVAAVPRLRSRAVALPSRSGRGCRVSRGHGRADRLCSASRLQRIRAAIRSGHRHLVALVAVTVKVDELPEVIEVGLAVMLTVGAAATGYGRGGGGLASRSGRGCRVSRGRGRADRLCSASRLQRIVLPSVPVIVTCSGVGRSHG
jgi:hypothetical protein